MKKFLDPASPQHRDFWAAITAFDLHGDIAPLAEYLASDKPLDSVMRLALARVISGKHGKVQRFVLQVADVGFQPDPEEEKQRYRDAAEKIWLLVICKGWKKEMAFEHIRKDRKLGAVPLRAALRKVEEDFEHELPVLRGPTAKGKRRPK